METENSLASLAISAAAAAPRRLDMGATVGAPVAAATNESPEEEELQAQRIASDSAFDSFLVDEHEQNGKWEGHSMFAPFTSGWQQTETEPLIVAKGEVCNSSSSHSSRSCFPSLVTDFQFTE
jgi:hypothetical protein